MDPPSAKLRLSTKDDAYLNVVFNHLKASGATDDEVEKSADAISDAIYASSKADACTRAFIVFLFSVSTVIMMAPLVIYFLGMKVGGWASKIIAVDFIESAIGLVAMSYFATGIFGVIKFTRRAMMIFTDRKQKDRSMKNTLARWIASILFVIVTSVGSLIWVLMNYQLRNWSLWNLVVISLLIVWIFTILSIISKIFDNIRERSLAYWRPDRALIIFLCKAFLAVREEFLWHDQAHRNRISMHLELAAKAIENFTPRYLATQCDFTSMLAVRERFRETAARLRRQIVWLATPGALTRVDLEAALRGALLAASLGELDRLGVVGDAAQADQPPRRSWWSLVTELCRSAAWALTPLALVQLGSALQLPLLSEHDQQMAAQKAAYIWLAIAILRGLSPGNFKETVDAASSLLGRSRSGRPE